MVNVSSLPMSGNTLFDLDSQAGITAVLLALRASELSASQKNELRDLVFQYTNGGKDQAICFSLQQKISTYGLVPVATKSVAPAVPRREFPTIGTYRSTPAFAIPEVSNIKKAEPAAPLSPSTQGELTKTESNIPGINTLAADPISVTEETVAVPAVQMPKADQQQYLDRIREIKALVNEKVGNPVNLVDINNEVGREYMSALLDAMKRINSGMSADGAMKRLEIAYMAVEETLREAETSVATTQASQVSVVQSVSSTPEPAPVPYVAPVPPPVYVPVTSAVPPTPHYQSTVPSTPVHETTVFDQQYRVTPPVPPVEPVTQPVVPTPNYNQSIATAAPTIHSPIPHTFSSLADMVQQSNAQVGLPTTPSVAAPLVSGDPLLAPEVENGLTQLLSEWSIFKKSGIFGTGPKGREHPLYKKMAELQIPLLLAGRFEGATQEVRQSLTDYMNGWRYEQGLIYEKGEVFEHYLRRVIRQILDVNSR